MASRVTLPEMGEGVIEGTLSRWLVKEGDHVERYAPLAEVETDKVTTETTTEVEGTILKLCVQEGETVPVGTVLVYIGEPGEQVPENGEVEAGELSGRATETTVEAPPSPEAMLIASPATPPKETESRSYGGRISPVVGRMAAEHQIDLNQVPGTGRDGRITKNDILAYIDRQDKQFIEPPELHPEPEKKSQRPAPEPVPSGPTVDGAYDLVPHTNIRRTIAEHMVRSKQTSPHVTTVFEFDFSAVATHRKANKDNFARDGARLTFTAYIVAAVVQALKAHPMVNSSWSDEGMMLRKEINIGMATAIDDGLIVPVIKNADGMNLLGLARTINDLAERARRKQLRPDEVKGGTFSITNHGTTGSLFATPIINQPQCGILGVGAIEKRVKVIDDAIAIRPQAFVSFTFDHRILDGASADRFVSEIKRVIENWR
jgi:pyruvate/2-oxoglutarate dehydrogenase complex dihydrolipoamide acyltransferase (E2) component